MRVTASNTRLEWPWAVSTTTRSTPASISRSVRWKPSSPDAGRRRNPQPALLVLASVGILLGLLDVLDRNEADAAKGLVHHQELLDPMLVQQSLGLVRLTPSFTVTSFLVISSAIGVEGSVANARRGW